MKKYFFFAALAVVALGACTKIETNEPVVNVDEPIAFGAYTGKSLTKAGYAGELTNAKLQSEGFGVIAFQTTGNYTAGSYPNFMYNTKVSGTDWTYSPVKYWPNQIQNGNTDAQTTPATAKQEDKVTFFAYAPWVDHTANLGTTGITAISANSATTDPKVTYAVSNDLDAQVDLCWGVVNPTSNQTWNTVVSGKTVSLDAGKPYLNLQKPAIDTKIHFYFRHALAQINLQAVGAFNTTSEGGTAKDNVRITIEKVVLSVPGITSSAVLNLNNTTANEPLWETPGAATDLSLEVSGSNLKSDIKDSGSDEVQTVEGVTNSPKAVIVDNKYYTVIPKTGSTNVTVTITYYVTTPDNALKDGFSRVKNVITKDVTFSSGFAAGTKNTIKMILGISEVKFEASVEEWTNGSSSDVNLPINS